MPQDLPQTLASEEQGSVEMGLTHERAPSSSGTTAHKERNANNNNDENGVEDSADESVVALEGADANAPASSSTKRARRP